MSAVRGTLPSPPQRPGRESTAQERVSGYLPSPFSSMWHHGRASPACWWLGIGNEPLSNRWEQATSPAASTRPRVPSPEFCAVGAVLR